MEGSTPADVIAEKCKAQGLSFAALSRRLGRNHSYIHTFVSQGSPEVLPEEIRRKAALILGVSEAQLRPTLHGSPVDIVEATVKDADMRPAFRIGDVVFAEAAQPHPGDFVVFDSADGSDTSIWSVKSIDEDGINLAKLANGRTLRVTPDVGEVYRIRQANYA